MTVEVATTFQNSGTIENWEPRCPGIWKTRSHHVRRRCSRRLLYRRPDPIWTGPFAISNLASCSGRVRHQIGTTSLSWRCIRSVCARRDTRTIDDWTMSKPYHSDVERALAELPNRYALVEAGLRWCPWWCHRETCDFESVEKYLHVWTEHSRDLLRCWCQHPFLLRSWYNYSKPSLQN